MKSQKVTFQKSQKLLADNLRERPSIFRTFNSYSFKFKGGLCPPYVASSVPGRRNFFSYDIFVHGSKCQFIDGINLNLTHVCVCCEIIFVFTYIALVVFVYKVKQKIIIQ